MTLLLLSTYRSRSFICFIAFIDFTRFNSLTHTQRRSIPRALPTFLILSHISHLMSSAKLVFISKCWQYSSRADWNATFRFVVAKLYVSSNDDYIERAEESKSTFRDEKRRNGRKIDAAWWRWEICYLASVRDSWTIKKKALTESLSVEKVSLYWWKSFFLLCFFLASQESRLLLLLWC